MTRAAKAPSRAPELRIQFTKRPDGMVVFRCVRPDGSTTWQRQEGSRAMFFPFHDLSHFAVETVLGFRQGFYGLLADGWDVEETGGKSARGPLPPETVLVEHIVGLFDRERIGGAAPMTAAEFNAQLAQLSAERGLARARPFMDSELEAVRRKVDALHDEWAVLATGGTLELLFDRIEPNR